MTYKDAFIEALTNKELIQHYDRLFNAHLSTVIKGFRTGGLTHEIDVASGFAKAEIEKFDAFFFEYVWKRIPKEQTN